MKWVRFASIAVLLFTMAGCSPLGNSSEKITITVTYKGGGEFVRVTDVTTNFVFDDDVWYNKTGTFSINKGDVLRFEVFGYGGSYITETTSESYQAAQSVTIQ